MITNAFNKQVDFLTALGLRCRLPFYWTIAGGACRNIYFGLKPKDYDVIVILPSAMRNHEGAFAMAQELSLLVSAFGGSSQCIAAYGIGEFAERHLAVLKVTYDGDDYDFLIETGSFPDAINNFDCNLNQGYYAPMSKSIVGRLTTDKLEDGIIWSKEVSAERKAKMEAFFYEHVSAGRQGL